MCNLLLIKQRLLIIERMAALISLIIHMYPPI